MAEGRASTPRTIAFGLLLAPLFTAGVVAGLGLLLALHHLPADGLLSRELAETILHVHLRAGVGALGAVVLVPWIPRLLEASTTWWRVAALALAVLLVALVAPALACLVRDGGYVNSDPSVLCAALGVTAAAAVGARRDLATVALALVALAWLTVGAVFAVPTEGVLVPTSTPALLPLSVVAALAAAFGAYATGRRAVAVALGLALLALGPLAWWANLPGDVPRLLRASIGGAVWLLGVAGVFSTRSTEPLGPRLSLVLATLGAAVAAALDGVTTAGDAMLEDTLVGPGIAHVRLAAITCAALACTRTPWCARTAVPALASFAAGSAALSIALLSLGLQGMPTRYVVWSTEGSLWRVVAVLGAILTLVGGALWARAVAEGRHTPLVGGGGAT